MPADEVAVVDGIPVTDVARTLIDLAGSAARSQVKIACNEAEVRGLTSKRSVPELLDRYPGRRGSEVLREIYADVEALSGITHRGLEERFARLIAKFDLPHPFFNADVSIAGRFFEVDCLWSAQRLIVELDGRAVHGTRLAFERDRERDRLLAADGWRVIRITWRQLDQDAAAVVADLRTLLR